jgi:putative Ig domain-containing protein
MYRIAPLFFAVLLFQTASAASHPIPQGPAGARADSARGYSLVLVDASSNDELVEARDFIMAQGGTVSIVLPPHSIMGWIPPEVASRIQGKHHIRSIHRSVLDGRTTGFRDRETTLAINAFNDIASGRQARRAARESQRPSGPEFDRPGMIDCTRPRPALNRADFIRNLQRMGADEALRQIQSTVTPQFFSNSDVMDGSIAVAVFLVESAGGIDPNLYTWSTDDQNLAISQVIDGLNWWVDQSRAFSLQRPLTFTVIPFLSTNPVCQQPYEPILHSGSDANLWIGRIMDNLGATDGDTIVKVAAFDQKLRFDNHTDWAYSIFIGYNPPPARTSFLDSRASWAYIGGPHANVLFRSFGWQLSQIISHESGHIFFACDEYFSPGYQTCSCSCAPEIRPQATNGNCQDTSCNPNSTACMMRSNDLALCSFTVAQIGWTSFVPKPVPTSPTGLVATAPGPTQVDLIWADTSTVEDGFQIERRGGTSADFSQVAVVSANTTHYSDLSVLGNTAYAYRVRAFNSTGTSPFSDEVPVITPTTASTLAVTTAQIPDATVDVQFSSTLGASGGTGGYSWLIESGSLPTGLSLSQSGTISGTPTIASSSTFVVRVLDGNNNHASKGLTLIVKPAAPLTISTTQLPRGSVGTTYSQSLGAAGGQTPYTWSIQSGSLPDGLTLNQSGVISGTPERTGSSSFSLKLSDAVGANVTSTLSIIVNPAVLGLTVDTASLPDGLIGDDYSYTLRALGGTSPYRWEITVGRLPDGLQLTEGGVISGRPTTAGEVSFTITATDQSSQTVSKELSIDVLPASVLTILNAGTLTVGAVGVPYRIELHAISGTPPYSWSKKKKKKFGTFPDGISLSDDGVLSGTPTAEGVSNFTVRVTDSAGRDAAKPFSIEVGPPPPPLSVRTDTLPTAQVGILYRGALQPSGGSGPYSWSIDSGALPDGLTMGTDGIITGRPTQLGVGAFVVRVRDALNSTSVRSLFIVVSPPPPPLVIQTVVLPETSAESSYSQALQATGGVPPYTWSIASGSLGAGLNLSASGTISGSAHTPGTSVFVVRVTDSAQQSVTRTLAITIRPADRIAPFGTLETPDSRATLNRTASGSGWGLDNVGVTTVDILIDGQKIGEAIYGVSRPDIAIAWPTFPNAANAGFAFNFDTTKFSNGEHTLAVRLFDAAGNATVLGTRTIEFQNAVFSVITTDILRGRKGDPYSMQLAAANGRPPYTWTLISGSLPAGLSMNASGLISGTPTTFGNFPFAVRATDSVGATAVASFTLQIQSDIEPLQILSSGDLPQASTGVIYSQQLLFTGGTAPRAWSMASGSLPPGMTLGSSGIISGAPTNVGVYNFTVRLTDATQTSVTSQPLRITVTPGPLIIQSTGDLARGRVANSYSYTLQKIGGAPPYTWAVATGSLPPGLSLNASTGIISGVPTQDGTFSFTMQLTDSQPLTVTSTTMRIIVDVAALTITSSGDLTGGRVNQDYSYTLQFTGGRSPYTWAVTSGTLPNGLTLKPDTGVISGKPTATGNFAFTVSLTDGTPTTVQSSQLRIAITP